MPKIANLIPMDGDRLAVVLEPFDYMSESDELTIWTGSERRKEIAAHVKLERERCAVLALNYGGRDAEEIAELILSSDSQ